MYYLDIFTYDFLYVNLKLNKQDYIKNMCSNFIIALQKKIGYCFQQYDILLKALTHSSASSEHNERLEFLGDSVLNLVITKALYNKFPNSKEGDMSQMRSILVCGKALTEIAHKFRLGKYLLLGSGEIKNRGHQCKSILANAMEALIGGIFLDSNMEITEKTILNWYCNRLDEIVPGKKYKDAKTKLQEYLQERHLPLPSYSIINIQGEQHYQEFTINCKINGINTPIIGSGSSKRKAEQKAAKLAIKLLEFE